MMFFTIMGIIFVGVILLISAAAIYTFVLYPVFVTISIMRWTLTCCKAAGTPYTGSLWKLYRGYYVQNKNIPTRISNNYGEWYGIGKWRLYPKEDIIR